AVVQREWRVGRRAQVGVDLVDQVLTGQADHEHAGQNQSDGKQAADDDQQPAAQSHCAPTKRASRRVGAQRVTETANGLNETVVVAVELAPQVADVRLDDVVVAVEV